ncbi:Tim10/DDP family zinc finger-domain-containing protein [Dimargaris cristalligena]|uniref:Mitochondrial import inner membrane translocase subunit n=1 Tax=Dimargaris cristalligena TaxID=215637 RepID=A0A4P9ZX42_9FUNG|nr:Tim10/DDP family zinc finger-domain-containing protein [Dimargaris cristalligena]|eukprot:RKP37571.1 Tim10/DDP family zinc finger-domain-containing protein [Dimargaris cristalligena]
MFGRGGNAGISAQQSQANLMMAEQEIEMVTDLFNRVSDSCLKKCIPDDYLEADLNKGESVCLDRCVSKFFEVNKKVGAKLQEISGQNQANANRSGGLF